MTDKSFIEDILNRLANDRSLHVPGSAQCEALEEQLRSVFADTVDRQLQASDLLDFKWPYRSFGVRSTNHLLDLPTFMSIAFYAANRNRYKTVFDIGANAGMHTLALSNLGFHVTSFEPDPVHLEMLRESIELNKAENVTVIPKAVWNESGTTTFVRVDQNTTASHIKGTKDGYGELTELQVETVRLIDVGEIPDLIKIDAEGAEGEIIASMPTDWWEKVDILGEVHGESAAEMVYENARANKINIFAQRLGWEPMTTREQMPSHHTHGNIFMTRRDSMPWG